MARRKRAPAGCRYVKRGGRRVLVCGGNKRGAQGKPGLRATKTAAETEKAITAAIDRLWDEDYDIMGSRAKSSFTADRIAEAAGLDLRTTRNALTRMVRRGTVRKTIYEMSTPRQARFGHRSKVAFFSNP